MQPSADPELRLPPGWDEMLTRVEQMLAAAAATAAQREQALQGLAVAPTTAAGAAVLQGLDRFQERVRGLAECAARADLMAGDADAALGGAEDALRGWFQGIGAARRKLADWAGKP
jgi:hypothetical protein